MDAAISRICKLGCEKYPKASHKRIEYGTAGFRDKATELPHIMFRMGVLAVLRSKVKNGATIGVMITASHNPEEDNGVKLVDPLGEMLEADWEILATDLANAEDEKLKSTLEHIMVIGGIDFNIPGNVFLARDTRLSSPFLSQAALDGAKAIEGVVKDYGLLTTPQLHFMVCCQNTNGSYGIGTPEGYCEKLSSAFLQLRCDKNPESQYVPDVSIDGANGIGAYQLKTLIPYVVSSLNIEIFNAGQTGMLNYKCGADYVKVQQKPPEGIELSINRRYASFDGDADRLIYFYLDKNKEFHMLDGDKIATLIAVCIKNLVEGTGIDLELCVIQTAYANGNSTNYISNVLKIPVACVPTGVKHLHHKAKQYDVGIYFEANGHGTVTFSSSAKHKIKDLASNPSAQGTHQKTAQKLLNVINLINETVGDAISDLLLVETILHVQGWSISDWDHLYVDLPNRQLKAKVPDRNMITTRDAERICVEPAGLQDSIDILVSKFNKARAFVRPSGTEDIVRIYAEADTQENADTLAQEISMKVKEFTSVA